MKIRHILLLVTTGLIGPANAAFVSFDTGGARGHEFLAAPGTRVTATALAPANIVRFGYLTTPNLSSSFVEFSRTTVNNPLASQLIGGFVNADTSQNASAAAVAALKAAPQVAIWVFGQGNSQGLFTSTGWAAPASLTEAVDSSYLITLGVAAVGMVPPVVTAIPIPGVSPATFLPAQNITVGTGSNANGSRYTLGVIPEPTVTLFLATLGCLGLIRRQR